MQSQATQTMQSIQNYLEDNCEFNLQAGANFIKISKKKKDEQEWNSPEEWKDYNKGNSKKNKKSKHKDKRQYDYEV